MHSNLSVPDTSYTTCYHRPVGDIRIYVASADLFTLNQEKTKLVIFKPEDQLKLSEKENLKSEVKNCI